MKTAVIGSRGIVIDNLQDYLPEGTTEIVSGGAKGVDTCAERGIPVTVHTIEG